MLKQQIKKEIIETYPYQNLELIDLPGEQWDDIPGLDGYYLISNLGRVKRMEFEMQYSNGVIRRMKSMIKKSDLSFFKNKAIKDKMFFLRNKIRLGGIMYDFSIPRMVYYCFIEKFDWYNYSFVVLAKDGNGKNICHENLALVDLSSRRKRVFERNRYIRTSITSYEEFIRYGVVKSVNPYCRQISQYSTEGKKIATFPSAKTASLVLGIPDSRINSVLKQRQILAGGFAWQYGDAIQIDIKSRREDGKLNRKKLKGQKITQYDATGKRLATYICIADAGRATGINNSDISCAVNNKQKSAGGFIWKKGWGEEKIDLTNYVYGEAWRMQKMSCKVKQYAADGKYLQTFASIRAAARQLGTTASNIRMALEKQRLAKGFRWKLV